MFFAVLLVLASAALQESCPNCLHRGVLRCKEHDEVSIEEEEPGAENPMVYCSWAAACEACAGSLWVDCPRCARGELTKEVEERQRVIQSWLENSQLKRALGRPVHGLETTRFSIAVDVAELPSDDKARKKMSGHLLAHQIARDGEHVAALVAEHYQMTPLDYRAKMRMWLWGTLETHHAAQEKFQGALTTGDFKLLGRDPVFSVWIDPPNFDTVPKVRAVFAHNAGHMLLSNAFRPDYVGDIGGGWLDAGLGHWYEYELFGRTLNYCLEEATLLQDYENGQWRAAVRRRLEREKDPFLPGLLPKRTTAMSAAEHALCWSFYDYLLAEHPGIVRALMIDLKQRKPGREVLAQHLAMDLFATESAWRDWVGASYPSRGDEPRKAGGKKGRQGALTASAAGDAASELILSLLSADDRPIPAPASMQRTSPKPALLLCVVGVILALVVGLIGSAKRGPTLPRALPDIEPSEPYSPARSALQSPRVLPPVAEHGDLPADAEAPLSHTPVPESPELTRLVGFVLRADGEPASRARVVLGKQHARCDAQGQFQMAIGDDVAGADLLAFEPGSEPALRPAFGSGLAGSGEFQVRLLLGPETLTLAGTVVDSDGNGLKGWAVELDGLDLLQSFNLRERVRTDGDGRFELTDVTAGGHVVRAWKEDPAAALRSAPAAAGETGIRIVVLR